MQRSIGSPRFVSFAAILFLLSAASFGSTFTVTTTADSGPGSLRQAILDANLSAGSTVAFSIGAGVHTIRPLTELPEATTVIIDGTTQPGYAGTPLIEIDGSLLPAFSSGLKVAGGVVKGLAINRCAYVGLWVAPATVTACFLGTDVTGQVALGNGVGIRVINSGSVIGGTAASSRNVVSGNNYGIYVSGSGTIVGNFVGTDVSGTAALPNLGNGIAVESTSFVTIGTAAPGAGNLISGNVQYGVSVYTSTDVAIQGNTIGPASGGGSLPSSNQRAGVMITGSSRTLVGGLTAAEANTIAYHTFTGIGVEPGSTRNRLLRNSLFANAFGIDLDFDLNDPDSRVTPNDPGDADSGPNLLQNFPVLTSVISAGGSTTIAGSINTTSDSPIHLEFFSNASCNASGNGEGRTFLGSAEVVTNSSGNAFFETPFSLSVSSTDLVTATATDELGDTSEFSACQSVTGTAPPGQNFFTVTPCRVVDTRAPDGPLGGPALAGQSVRVFTLAGTCNIPSSAKSVSANLTVTQPAAPGHLTIHPADVAAPLASSINFAAGRTRSNNAILRLSNDGTGSITVRNAAAGSVHFILDVNGYFE